MGHFLNHPVHCLATPSVLNFSGESLKEQDYFFVTILVKVISVPFPVATTNGKLFFLEKFQKGAEMRLYSHLFLSVEEFFQDQEIVRKSQEMSRNCQNVRRELK